MPCSESLLACSNILSEVSGLSCGRKGGIRVCPLLSFSFDDHLVAIGNVTPSLSPEPADLGF